MDILTPAQLDLLHAAVADDGANLEALTSATVSIVAPSITSDFRDVLFDIAMRCSKYHVASPKQRACMVKAAQRLLDRELDRKPAAPPAQETSNLVGIITLLQGAAQHKQFPKLRVFTSRGPIHLVRAGKGSAREGAVNIKRNDEWLGRIELDGSLTWGRGASYDDRLALAKLLDQIGADPATTLGNMGRANGMCCFCNAGLTDQRSVMVGYGPICAENHGLPWGERPSEAAAVEQGVFHAI